MLQLGEEAVGSGEKLHDASLGIVCEGSYRGIGFNTDGHCFALWGRGVVFVLKKLEKKILGVIERERESEII